MSNYTLKNMTPGAAADCYLPGCQGVVGGLCVGALPDGAPLNQTLWWCCTPYAETCRGGQSACPGTSCGSGSTTWCCNSELESCPGADGIEGSCIPKDYANPVLNGPAWGPDASASANTSAITGVSSTTSSSSSAPASETATGSAAPTETSVVPSATGGSGGVGGISAGGAAGVGVVGGGLFVLAVVGAVWWFRRRRGAPGGGRYVGEMYAGGGKPLEVEGHSLHEMEGAVSVTSEMEGAASVMGETEARKLTG